MQKPQKLIAINCGHETTKVCKGLCRNCYDRKLKEINPSYADHQRLNSLKWHAKNRNYIKQYQHNKWINMSPEKRWIARLKKVFGITPDEYISMLQNQNGCCAICGKHYSDLKRQKHFHIDHDHKTKEIRGLLCFRCNFGLGWFQENKEWFVKAIQHLNGVNSLDKKRIKYTRKDTNSKKIHIGYV